MTSNGLTILMGDFVTQSDSAGQADNEKSDDWRNSNALSNLVSNELESDQNHCWFTSMIVLERFLIQYKHSIIANQIVGVMPMISWANFLRNKMMRRNQCDPWSMMISSFVPIRVFIWKWLIDSSCSQLQLKLMTVTRLATENDCCGR
jgi:hypothetical protein